MARLPTTTTVLALIAATVLATGCNERTQEAPFRVVSLASPAGPGSMAPHLALSTDGRAVMSWLEPAAEGRHALRFATLDGEAWSAPRTVAEGADWFINWADFPSVTPITASDWVAHWLVKQAGGTYSYDVAIAISRDGGASWGTPLTPHDDGTRSEHGFVTLFPWGDGFGVTWLDGRYTSAAGASERPGLVPGMTVRAARFGFDGSIREAAEIDALACDCCATDVAISAGEPVLTWRDRTAQEIRDIAVSRYSDGAWASPVLLGDDQWQIAGCPVNGSAIAARDERVAVAWYTAPNRQPRVQLAWSSDGGRSFSPPVVVDEGTVSGRVDVVMLPDGSALVSWMARPAQGPGQIRMRRVPAAGAPGPIRVIAEGEVSRASGFPQMIEAGERLVYAWTQPGESSQVLTAWSAL